LSCGDWEVLIEADQDDIRSAFVAAYPRYVASVLASQGVAVDEVLGDAIVEGTAVLDGLLGTFESTDLATQTSSPLELFREALRPIDRALSLMGVPLPSAGSGPPRVAPWDSYGLSPGSSQVLGAKAQEAHLAWGLSKAQAIAGTIDSTRGPVVGLFCPAGDIGGLVAEAEAMHYRTIILPTDSEVSVAVVCADEPGADALVLAVSHHAKVIVYGRTIDDMDQVRFASVGASSVVGEDRLLGNLARYLPVIS
jgi:hypothetical protein